MPQVEVTTTTTTTISINMKTAAEWFQGLSDEQQADFFIEVAKLSQQWECRGHWASQYWLVGRHLRDCSCSTEEARELVKQLASGMQRDRAQVAAA